MGLLPIPTLILLAILIILVVFAIIALIAAGLINLQFKGNGVAKFGHRKQKSIGDQVKERQEMVKDGKSLSDSDKQV